MKDLYKIWKNQTLQEIQKWFDIWIFLNDNKQYAIETLFKKLQDVLHTHFQNHWLFKMFSWSQETVNFNECSTLN